MSTKPVVTKDSIRAAFRRHLAPLLPTDRIQLAPPQEAEALREYESALLQVLCVIKLVIWDLDNTYWQGTLGEGSMEYVDKNHDLVIALSRFGIINSICSHNDFAAATSVLSARGIMDYFVSPQISYGSKAQMVRQIIDSCRLRPENVLYLEDELRFRQEVEYFIDGITTASIALFEPVDLSSLQPTDPGLERLKQYKNMEAKDALRVAEDISELEFLRLSEIRLYSLAEVNAHVDRVVDLVNRANQLNFTKVPLTASSLKALLQRSDTETRCIRVVDRFGDYGICGFYSLNRTDNRLEHFVFSCRVLGMGIEQYVYDVLNRPRIEVRGEVSSSVEGDRIPDWIKFLAEDISLSVESGDRRPPKMLLKGGCDLDVVTHFIRSPHHDWQIAGEFNHNTPSGKRTAWSEHTDIVRASIMSSRVGTGMPELLNSIAWFTEDTWHTDFGSAQHDIYVFSPLQDFICSTYRHNETGLIIPCQYFGIDLLNPRFDEMRFSIGREDMLSLGITPEFLAWFRSSFTSLGPISPQRFRDNVCWLYNQLPGHALLVFVNAPEVDMAEQAYPYDRQLVVRHREMNRVLDTLVNDLPRARLIDVRKHVRSEDDLTDCLIHYKRRIYAAMGQELKKICQEQIDMLNVGSELHPVSQPGSF